MCWLNTAPSNCSITDSQPKRHPTRSTYLNIFVCDTPRPQTLHIKAHTETIHGHILNLARISTHPRWATPRYTLKQDACAAAARVSAAVPPVSMGGAGLAPGMPGGEGLR